MDELLEQFLIEGRELVAEAHGALGALGRNVLDRAAIDQLFRAAHTLKGSVALFDMAPAEQLLHRAESRLDAARKGEAPLDEAALDALVAIVDQTDRWIDSMETVGALDDMAKTDASRLAALLAGQAEGPAPASVKDRTANDSGDGEPAWLAALRARPEFAKLDPARARTAFRYTPDANCFFRGEDPLALAASVPDLLAFALSPAGEQWPALADFEPFRCVTVLEGVCGADADAVHAALRLAADQVEIVPLAAAPGRPAADPAPQSSEAIATLRVEAARLDRLADESGELGVAIRALGPIGDRLRSLDPLLAAELRAARDAIERVAGRLQHMVAQVRLVPLEPVLRRLPRLARDAAARLDKPLRFTLEGETSQVDKQIADQLFEPLLHLVRNAVDHGIEAPADRIAAGKAAAGHIRLSVRADGDGIAITLADDGGGIDPAKIRQTAIRRGLMTSEAADALPDAEALHLVFRAGFSTAASTTSLSGRGVGMDAVRASIERLAGTVGLESRVGQGTCITLRLPANAITSPLLVVEAGGQRLGLRLDQVIETTRVPEAAIEAVGLGKACVLRGAAIPVLDLADRLGLGQTAGDPARLVVTHAGSGRAALRVAAFGERFDAVVRKRDGLLAALPSVAGTAVMADGSLVLVIDLPELIA